LLSLVAFRVGAASEENKQAAGSNFDIGNQVCGTADWQGIEDLWEPWMKEVDQLQEDAALCFGLCDSLLQRQTG
jgi:hypothetical protein